MKNFSKITAFMFLLLLTHGCNYLKKEKSDPSKNENDIEKVEKLKEKKRFEPNLQKKSEEYVSKGNSLLFGKKDKNFGNRNAMWEASLIVLEDFPIAFASYNGSILSTDWYGTKQSNENIKIKIEFLDDKISPRSIKINSFKRICENDGRCNIKSVDQDFNKKIKEQIILKTKEIVTNKATN